MSTQEDSGLEDANLDETQQRELDEQRQIPTESQALETQREDIVSDEDVAAACTYLRLKLDGKRASTKVADLWKQTIEQLDQLQPLKQEQFFGRLYLVLRGASEGHPQQNRSVQLPLPPPSDEVVTGATCYLFTILDDRSPTLAENECWRRLMQFAWGYTTEQLKPLRHEFLDFLSASCSLRQKFAANLPRPTPTLPLETPASPKDLEDSIDAIIHDHQGQVVDLLNDWLARLAEVETKFPCEQAEARIDDIKRRVARAGCELLYDNQRVNIYIQDKPGAAHSSMMVMTAAPGPQRQLYGKVAFPLLVARPIS